MSYDILTQVHSMQYLNAFKYPAPSKSSIALWYKHSVSFILDFLSVMHAKLIYICPHMGASYSQRWAVPLINLSFSLPSKDSPQPLIILFHSQLCKSYLFGLLLMYCDTVNVIQIYQSGLLNGTSPVSASHHTIGSCSFL